MPRETNHELRKNILEKSFSLFVNNGYEATTTREIASACEIDRGLLHHYFPQKQNILFLYYAEFGEYLTEFVEAKLHDQSSAVVTAGCHIVYYKSIFSDPRITRILASILKNRDLTKIKINLTMDSYIRHSDRYGYSYDRTQLRLATMIMIGAEVELFLNIYEGELQMSIEELTYHINRLFLTYVEYGQQEIEDICSTARRLTDEFDYSEFKRYIYSKCPWLCI